jgi:hypothetical protein
MCRRRDAYEEASGLGIITAERQFLQRPNVIAIFG